MKQAPAQYENHNRRSLIPITSLFFVVILLIPLIMDYFVRLAGIVGVGPGADLWLESIVYAAAYLVLLFYMLTTFEPLRSYGYSWNTEHIGWAFYIGIGSGIMIFIVDRISSQSEALAVPAFSLTVFAAYMLSWVVLPALFEETLFRGVIQRYYQKNSEKTFTSHKIHVAVFIAVAAELLFHIVVPLYYTQGSLLIAFLRTIPQLIYVAVFGFISGVFYQRTGSLTGPMLIHALGNGTELLLLWVF